MPVIVYKTLTLNIKYAQARRILCEHCRQPFTYVWGDSQEFKATGVPLLSSDDGMRKSAMKQAANALAKVAKSPNKGLSMCPHCHCYQSWMVRKSWLAGLGCGLVAGLLLTGIVAIVAGIWFSWGSGLIAAVVAAGAVAGLAFGATSAVRKGPHPQKKDESAMTDGEVPALLKTCQEKNADFVLLWYLALGNKVAEKQALVSLGVYDTTGQRPLFPRELTTTHALVQLRQ
jgi:hypothetical protein